MGNPRQYLSRLSYIYVTAAATSRAAMFSGIATNDYQRWGPYVIGGILKLTGDVCASP
jgi:hypothetical protein